MARIVESNNFVQTKTNFMQTQLSVGGTFIRLFQNNITPTPANLVGDFNEANFDTYTPRGVSGLWSAISQVQPGEWHFFSPIETYSAPSTVTNTIYGCYVTNSSGLMLSVRFDAPVIMQPGGLPFSLQLEIIDWAASILGAP